MWLFWQMIFENVFHLYVSTSMWGNQGCQLAAGSTKSWILEKVIAQLEHLDRKPGGLIFPFLLFLKGRNKNKCHNTDTMNHLLSLNCSVVHGSFVNNWVALLWGPALQPCPGWYLKERLIPSPSELCCTQWELEMSIPWVTRACWYTWVQMCLRADSICQGSSLASPGHWWQKNVTLMRENLYSDKRVLSGFLFYFEVAFSEITGRKTCGQSISILHVNAINFKYPLLPFF